MTGLLIEGGTLLGLTEPADVHPGADLYAEDGRIRATGGEATRAAGRGAVERLDARGQWVLPGFVQAHLHLCQTLLRNGPDDLELLPWLERHVWPGEAAHDAATMSISARLGLAESLSAGVTAVLDMGTVRHSDALFEAAAASGIRYLGGNVLMDDPDTTPAYLRASARDGLAETERLRTAWHGKEDGRLRVAVQPRFAVSCTDGLLRAAAELARDAGLVIHTHASENRAECALVEKRTGLGNVAYLDSVGLLSPRSCVAHAVHTDESDFRLLSRRETTVVHCPSSNLKLASGLCPVPELKRAGVRVALGSDGAACNNRLDPFREMRLAAFLPRARPSAGSLSAFEVLRMATWDGCRALGLDGPDGFVPGARADFVVLDPERGWSLPDDWSSEPYGAIVYSMGRENVSATIVDGVVCYRRGDETVAGLKPSPEEIRAAVRAMRARM
ncbi:MAG: amidohydrolase family protein [Acidobacteriota bacterium]|nr:amidohydrolase family protein [Acidobacteriota bacterium]MDQ5872588.1 amidohydrolase family protein [Acidobacteriota bacterium]